MPAKKPHLYSIGEEVNGLKILKKIRFGNRNGKGYEVQSLTYPNAPTYNVYEDSLKNGRGCAYKASHRVFEGNSLYSIERVRPHIINIDDAKKVTPSSNKKMKFKCPICEKVKTMSPSTITHRGFRCNICSSNTSYPELFFMSYLEVKGIEYEYQKIFNDFGVNRFDFYIKEIGVVEVHGVQHYDSNREWFERSKTSDENKRKYCKENNINMIELDCRKSSFNFIKEEIQKNKFLEDISDCEVENMLKIIENNKNYPIKEIIQSYNDGMSGKDICATYGICHSTVLSILKKHNIKLRPFRRKIKCITTNEIFDSAAEASRKYNIHTSGLHRALSGEHKTAGGYTWEYVD